MTARPGRRRRRTATAFAIPLALAAMLLVLVPASRAQAHASLLESDPEDGAVLEAAPSAVTLTFNEPVDPVADAMRLVDQDGRDHPVEATATDLDVVITVPDLDEGRYVLSWRVISTDAHPIAGAVAFAVGTGTSAPVHVDQPVAEESDRLAPMAVNALHYLGLLVFAGFLFFKIAIARGLWPGRPRHRLLRLSGAIAVIAAAAAVPVDALAVAGLPLSRIVDIGAWSATVQTETVAILVLTAAGVGSAHWWFTRGRGSWAAPLALGSAAAATAGPVLIGHSMLFGPRWLMAGADVVHLFTGAVWTGGLIGLIVLLRHARGAGAGAAGPATVVARFSTWAGATVGLLGASGLAMAVMIHREWGGFFGSDHGRLLLVKVGLVALAAGLAAWNRFRLVPAVQGGAERRDGLRRLGRVLLAEAAAVLSVIAVTATLVHLNPDGEASEAEDTTVTQRHDLGTGELSAVLAPGGTGPNTLTLELTDADGRPMEPLERPMVLASLPEQDFGPITTEASPDPDGGHRAELDLPLPGRWEIEIHVRLSEFEHHIATVTADIS
ncbi:copper resistance CopC/CopD family protein [Glycomyces tarimensis]